MLNYLEDIKDYDILWFVPNEEDENSIRISSNLYKNAGESIGGSDMGPLWHIVLFQSKDEDSLEKLDHFEAILTDPREYISNLIPQGWYGIIARKTTTSKAFIDDVLAKLSEI